MSLSDISVDRPDERTRRYCFYASKHRKRMNSVEDILCDWSAQTPQPVPCKRSSIFSSSAAAHLAALFLCSRTALLSLAIILCRGRETLWHATNAAMVNIPYHLIKTMDRWLSVAYQLYIRTPSSVIDSVAARLVS